MALHPFKEIEKALDKAAKETYKQVIKQLRKEGGHITKSIKAGNVPRETGALQKSLGYRVWQKKRGFVGGAVIGARSGSCGREGRQPRFYLHMLEYGTSHSKAQPFMRAAFMASANSAMDRILDSAKKAL